jgi:acyl-coenzyme A synthetase/AMP-(fatty) acid ligase
LCVGSRQKLSDVREQITGSIGGIIEIDKLKVAGANQASLPMVEDPHVGGVVLSSSGSTGVPKLIVRSPASFYHRVAWTNDNFQIKPCEPCVQKSHMTTTHSLYEMLEPLLMGAPLHILPDVSKTGLSQFWKAVQLIKPQRLLLVPSLVQATVDNTDMLELLPDSLRMIVLMGEAPRASLCKKVLSAIPNVRKRFFSIYGSTEASSSMVLDIGAHFNAMPDCACLPLGCPIDSRIQTWVLDENGKSLVDNGSTGKLYFTGPQIFQRYLGAEELTMNAFYETTRSQLYWSSANHSIDMSIPKDKELQLFCTQDCVRISDKGQLECVGRSDDVVKVRGNRVQLSELDCHLERLAGVRQSMTLLISTSDDHEPVLVSFITPANINRDDVMAALSQRVPDYMMPQLMPLSAMPLTQSSKIDRIGLKALFMAQSDALTQTESPKKTLDSLGLVKNADPWELVEMGVIRDLYCFGVVGVIIAHWIMYVPVAPLDISARFLFAALGNNIWHIMIFPVALGYSDSKINDRDKCRVDSKDIMLVSLLWGLPWFHSLLSWQTPSFCLGREPTVLADSCMDFWQGPRVYLATMAFTRLYMKLLFRFQCPWILKLMSALLFSAMLDPFATAVRVHVGQPFAEACSVPLLDILGVTVRNNTQIERYVPSYAFGLLVLPLLTRFCKTHVPLSRMASSIAGVSCWMAFTVLSSFDASHSSPVGSDRSPYKGLPYAVELFGVRFIMFYPHLIRAWAMVVLLGYALLRFPLTGVPDIAKHNVMAGFLLSAATMQPRMMTSIGSLSAALQIPSLLVFWLFFMIVPAGLLQLVLRKWAILVEQVTQDDKKGGESATP